MLIHTVIYRRISGQWAEHRRESRDLPQRVELWLKSSFAQRLLNKSVMGDVLVKS